MRKLAEYVLTALALLSGASCKEAREELPGGTKRYVITSTMQSLRTALDSDRRSVVWQEADRVAVVTYNEKTGTWGVITDLAPSSVSGASARFSFTLESGTEPVCLTYPSRSSTSYQAALGGVRTRMDSPLYLVADALPLHAKGAEVSLANTSLGMLSEGTAPMQNALSLLQIKLTSARTSRIVLRGNGSEPLSGEPVFRPSDLALVGWDSSAPTLELLPSEGETLAAGTYYIPFVPQTFSGGITMTLVNAVGGEVSKSSAGAFTFERNRVYDLGSAGATVVIRDLGSEAFRHLDDTGAFDTDDPVRDDVGLKDTLSLDIIPDFSRVGYKYGDVPIPDVPVVCTIGPEDVAAALAAGTAPDTTSFIQAKLDEVAAAGGGALLLRNGEYHVGQVLFLDRDNTVLRGESESGTVLVAEGTRRRPVVWLGACSSDRVVSVSYTTTGDINNQSVSLAMYNPKAPAIEIDYNRCSVVSEPYVPAGRMSLQVDDPGLFAPGDRIVVIRPGTPAWISDIGMDKIVVNLDQIHPTTQWDPANFYTYHERRVTYVAGNCIGLDAPLVMSLDRKYGKSLVAPCSWNRITGSGIEHLTIDVVYDSSKLASNALYPGGKYCHDEEHAWHALCIAPAEHCWVRHVTSRHHGMSMVYFRPGARLCTAEYCTSVDPVSIIRGSRRYAFILSNYSSLNLIQHCSCDHDRHCTATSGKSYGPNVFYDVTCTNAHAELGPHMGWGTGTLYDNVSTDYGIQAIDRGNSGGNHGWAGVTQVFWNCTATGSYGLVLQSPWTSAYNYAVGCVGTRNVKTSYGATDYYTLQGLSRPEARWYPERPVGSGGGTHVSLPVDSGQDWWPRLTLDVFSHPQSLYLSQLEDRHARGIYLTDLL